MNNYYGYVRVNQNKIALITEPHQSREEADKEFYIIWNSNKQLKLEYWGKDTGVVGITGESITIPKGYTGIVITA